MIGTGNIKNIQPKEVWLANFPFEEDPQTSKLRPVIVLSQTDDGITVADFNEDSYLSVKVTKHEIREEDKFDTIIVKWKEASLHKKSVARVSKTKNLSSSEFIRKIGDADECDFENILTKYVQYLESIELECEKTQ